MWQQSQPHSKQWKQGQLYILVHGVRTGLEMNHQEHLVKLFGKGYPTRLYGRHQYDSTLPPSAPWHKSIYSRPFGSEFSFPSYVLLHFDTNNQADSHLVFILQHWGSASSSAKAKMTTSRLLSCSASQNIFTCLLPLAPNMVTSCWVLNKVWNLMILNSAHQWLGLRQILASM